ncbi:hypothetical protein [Aerolutibacter daejeonensis]|nr:hypothetical protein [Lysobacter daejeonensis]
MTFVTSWRFPVALALAVSLLAVQGCSTDECRKYSDYSCEQLKRQTFNVYYYDVPKDAGEERNLFAGQVVGLEACGMAASSMATVMEERREGPWSYVCCLKTDESGCAEKHR